MGLLELATICAMTIALLLVHILVYSLGGRRDNRLFLIYGVPACFLISSIITPPDLASMLLMGVVFSVVYAITVGVGILVWKRVAS